MARSSRPLSRAFNIPGVVLFWIRILISEYFCWKPCRCFRRNRCRAVSVTPSSMVPLQIFLNKWPKKFNMLYLFIYCVVAILFLYISYKLQGNWSNPIWDYRKMFIFEVGAAVIYWFWDSIIMNKNEYPYY